MEAKTAYRKALHLIQRTSWVIATAVTPEGWPESALRTNNACALRFPALKKLLNHKKLANCFEINSYSARLQIIAKNPKVALYYYDVCSGERVKIIGYSRVVKDKKKLAAFWQPEWEKLCPDGIDGDEYSLLLFEGFNLRYYDGVSESYDGPIVPPSK